MTANDTNNLPVALDGLSLRQPGSFPTTPRVGLAEVEYLATHIARLDGADADLARRIVETRVEVGGFSSVEDLGITLDIEPAVVDRLRERAIFLAL